MTAYRRIRTKACGAALVAAVGLSLPAEAQNSQQPVDVTAAPPPSTNTVGPSQLRDFSLGGRPTQPATTPTPAPTQAAPQPTTAAPATTTPRPDAARNTAPDPQPVAQRAAPTADRALSPASVASQPSQTSAQPSEPVTVDSGIDSSAPVSDPIAAAPSTTLPAPGLSLWPWLAAFLAALGAGAFWWWSRRGRQHRQSDPGRMAFAGAAAEADSAPAPLPRAVPTPPTPAPQPQPAPPAAAPKPKSDGRITSTALKPAIELSFRPDRIVVTDSDVFAYFDIVVSNVGSAAARNVLIEAQMVCASPTQDQEIANFFQHPRGTGDRIPGIAPMDSMSLKSAVRMPIADVKSFEAGGRTLFVPLVAFNILYGATDQQASASFLVGRGKDGDEKLAPFRLDLGPRIFRGLAGRPHSSGLSAAA